MRMPRGEDDMTPYLRCSNPHRSIRPDGWPMLGADDETVALLGEGLCPICPDEVLDAPAAWPTEDVAGVCGCCGSSWRRRVDEYECLPGPKAELRQVG
jgi:hypothetical protein